MKIISRCGALLLILCLITTLLPLPASAGTYDIFTYEITDGKVTITGCAKNTTGKVVIPDAIEGFPVTAIGEEAFYRQTKITEIILPDTVNTISKAAFSVCSKLTAINLPSNLTSLNDSILYYCTNLTSLHIPASVTSIHYGAFKFCPKLSSLTVDKGNQHFHSVDNCIIETDTKTLVAATANCQIPADGSVTTIASGVFYNNPSLTTVTIPHGVTTVKGDAIMYCENLVSLHLSDTVNSFVRQTNANRKISSLTVDKNNPVYHSANNCIIETDTKTLIQGCSTSKIPTDGSITTIGIYAFYFSGVTSITIPEGVTDIKHAAFFSSNLTSISLPSTLETVGSRAFHNTSLSEVTFPSSVRYINNCLDSCENLKSVTILNPNAEIVGTANAFYGDVTIYGYPGSTAEAYAKEYGKTFVALGAHTCSYNQKVTAVKYLSNAASCTAPAKYFYSCTCGEKGTKTFTQGDVLAHTYDNACDPSCNACKATRTAPHAFSDTWKSNERVHWHECTCGAKSGESTHTWDIGTVTQKPTATENGTLLYTCTICGAQRTEDVAPTPGVTDPTVPTEPAPTEPAPTEPAPTEPTVPSQTEPTVQTQTNPPESTVPNVPEAPVPQDKEPSLIWILPVSLVSIGLIILIIFLLKRKKEKE